MNEDQLTRAVDHFADAARFAREARHEAGLRRSDEVERFAALAKQAAQDGLHELGCVS